jgi:hypothetical protein
VSTATKSQWEGRLGVEVIGRMGGCCAQVMLKWRPQMLGQRNSCSYCGTVMKTVQAGAAEAPTYTGGLNEHHRVQKTPELVLGGLYFDTVKFTTAEKADEWMDDRDIVAKAESLDMHAHYAPIERLLSESVRAVWAGPGVIAEVGIAEKQVATGGGQASMHSPGITTTSMAAGGTSHPQQQGPAALAVGQGGTPTLVAGMVEMNDGHQHEYHLTPFPANDGWRVKGYTSFNNGHTHYVEGGILKDGSVDLHTNPDQSPVGGHAHRHRLVWHSGAAVELPKNLNKDGEAQPADGREYRVTSQDVVTLRRAAGLIKTFCAGINGDRESITGAMAASMTDFQDQLSQAIERARGQVAHREGFVYLAKEDLDRLGSTGKFVGEFGERIAGGIGMEKDLEGDNNPFEGRESGENQSGPGSLNKQVDFARPTVDEINAISLAAGKGNPGQIEHLIEWAANVGVAECIEQVRASERASTRVDDPIKVCSWLKAQANEAAQTAEEA